MQTHKLFKLCSSNLIIPEEAVLSEIDEILWLLKDGKWHNSREIIERSSLLKSKLEMVISFLWEYDFVQVNENARKVRLRPLVLDFINEIQRVEKEEALSHKGFESAVGIKEFKSLRRSFKKV